MKAYFYECALSAGDQECGPARDRNRQPKEEWRQVISSQITKDKALTRSALGFVSFSGQVVGEGLCRARHNFKRKQLIFPPVYKNGGPGVLPPDFISEFCKAVGEFWYIAGEQKQTFLAPETGSRVLSPGKFLKSALL